MVAYGQRAVVAGTRLESFRLRKLAYFPAAFLVFAALAFCAPAADGRAIAIPVVIGLLVIAAGLVLMALMSHLVAGDERLDVRFFGLRSRAIHWESHRDTHGQVIFAKAGGAT